MRLLPGFLALATLAVAGCHDKRGGAPTVELGPEPPAIAPSSNAAPPPSVTPPARAPCAHRRPFSFSDEVALALPAPFDAFTPCDVLEAVFADYDRALETSAAAGGKVRIDEARRWDVSGRTLLAVVYYLGADAEAEFVCGQCRVAAHVAVVEQRGAALALVAKGTDPWQPKVDALFNGRAKFDTTAYAFTTTDPFFAVRTPWSTGMPGFWTNLTLYQLDGASLTIAFEYGVAWSASGMGTEDDDDVISEITFEPRAGGPSDLRVKTTEVRCHIDLATPALTRICGKPRPVGAERWRFDGKAYRRIEGKQAPLPRVLHKLWGW
jgi:hypothetical protein